MGRKKKEDVFKSIKPEEKKYKDELDVILEVTKYIVGVQDISLIHKIYCYIARMNTPYSSALIGSKIKVGGSCARQYFYTIQSSQKLYSRIIRDIEFRVKTEKFEIDYPILRNQSFIQELIELIKKHL